MKKLLLALMCVAGVFATASCGNFMDILNNDEGSSEVSADISRDEMIKQGFSIKLEYYQDNKTTWLVYTRKGDSYRWDRWDEDYVRACYYIKGDDEIAWEYERYLGVDYDEDGNVLPADEGEWQKAEYYRTMQYVTNCYGEIIGDGHELLSKYGYSKTGETTIMGLPCDVWSGTYAKPNENAWNLAFYGEITREGNSGEFCLWNGFTLRTKVNGKIQSECTAIVTGVPDTAFTNTADISWIK